MSDINEVVSVNDCLRYILDPFSKRIVSSYSLIVHVSEQKVYVIIRSTEVIYLNYGSHSYFPLVVYHEHHIGKYSSMQLRVHEYFYTIVLRR